MHKVDGGINQRVIGFRNKSLSEVGANEFAPTCHFIVSQTTVVRQCSPEVSKDSPRTLSFYCVLALATRSNK